MGKDKQGTLPRWIDGQQLINTCNINIVDLRDWVLNDRLTAYDPKTLRPLSRKEYSNPKKFEEIIENSLAYYFFKSDEFIQFASKHNFYQCLERLEEWYPDFFPKKAKGQKSLTSEEARELGRLRTEKKKWDKSIDAAVQLAFFCSKQNRPVTKKQLQDELDLRLKLDIPNTTFEKIWKAIPEGFRNLGGRPMSTS